MEVCELKLKCKFLSLLVEEACQPVIQALTFFTHVLLYFVNSLCQLLQISALAVIQIFLNPNREQKHIFFPFSIILASYNLHYLLEDMHNILIN